MSEGKALGILLRPVVRALLAPMGPSLGSVLDLQDNVVLTWALRRARRDPWTIAVSVIYLGVIYGILGVIYTIFAGSRNSRWNDFLLITHSVTWGANAFLFLLYVPTRFAQLIGFERERRTLDFLRMTALPGWTIALGSFAAAYAVPGVLFLCSFPQIFASLFSKESSYLVGVISAYAGLFSSSLIATTIAGVVAFVPKKAQSAGGAALLVVIALNALGGCYRIPFVEALGCLGPWGGLIGTIEDSREPFVLTLLGVDAPGLLLQVPFAIALSVVLLRAIASKIEDEQVGTLGARAAALVAAIIGVALVVSYGARPPENPLAWGWRSWSSAPVPGMAAGGRLIALLLATLPFAADAGVARDELVRRFARGADDRDLRILSRPSVFILVLFAAIGAVLAFQVDRADHATATFVAAVTAATYGAVAALTFQVARLVFPEKVPNVLAFAALAGAWMLPLLAGKIFDEMGAPSFVAELPTAFCPFVTVFRCAALHDLKGSIGDVNPIALALVAIALNGLFIAGLVAVARGATAQAGEFARSLVTLPADAFAAPGAVDRKCDKGHLYASTWDTCPHCPPAETSAATRS